MTQQKTDGRNAYSRSWIVVSAVAIIAGVSIVLDWVQLYSTDAGTGVPEGSTARGIPGYEFEVGLVVAACAGVALLAGIVLALRRFRHVAGLVAALAGLVTVVAAGLLLDDVRDVFVRHEVAQAVAQGTDRGAAEENIETFLEFGTVDVRVGPGVYLALASGLGLLIVGAFVVVRSPRRLRPATAPTSPEPIMPASIETPAGSEEPSELDSVEVPEMDSPEATSEEDQAPADEPGQTDIARGQTSTPESDPGVEMWRR